MGAGFLDTSQMAGAFQKMLRSNDLVWSYMSRNYPDGESDLMAWNANTTRIPYRMHAEYLRHLFLNNDLAEGRCMVGARPVWLICRTRSRRPHGTRQAARGARPSKFIC